ncbi:MAG: histidine kinase [Chloroflexota bacterium]|nr:PAS domain-containing protein [Chloroflexota bacterium]NOG62417.1 GAF domain-containing protein [Chloroflexota bacterium]GIK64110.1 MAG: histidine kinase [Chloroflexota bacterium]
MIILPDFRIHQRDYLLQISRAITAQLDLNEVLRLVLEASVSMLSGTIGMIALRGPDNTLRVQAVLGITAEQMELFKPLLEVVNGENEEEIDQDDLKLRLRLVSRRLEANLQQIVYLPMRISGEMLGIIYVFRPYPGNPSHDDHMILQSFADQAAIAVHNAGLYQAIIAEKQRLAAILDGSGDGVIILDADHRVMRINATLSRMIGWMPEYALGRLHEDIIRWAKPEPTVTLEKAIAEGWPFNATPEEITPLDHTPTTLYVEGDVERLDGLSLSIGIAYAPLFFKDGSLRNIIATVRDITRFREAEEMKSTFISVVSHELKTPVALIKGYAGTLRREDAEWDMDTIRRGLNIIEEEADRLTELIENLLMASKIQVEGMVHLEIDEIALDKLIRASVERFQTQTNKHTFKVEFPPDFPVILGDPRRLRQVIDNLISNAIKYSPVGGEVKITGQYDEDWIELTVSDQGIGIRPDEAERIFERFYRSDGSLSRSTPGTGLGLFLARAIIEAHGGTITATSYPDRKGTTFRITLPRQMQQPT